MTHHSNTLVFTNLPSCIFDTHILDILKSAIEAHALRSDNELYSWIPLGSFGRAIAIFWDAGDAQLCKDRLDRLAVGGKGHTGHTGLTHTPHTPHTPHLRKRHRARSDCAPLAPAWNHGFLLRVFSLPPTPTPVSTKTHSEFFLSVPGIEKNFLISPPGSPPVGWEPVKEDPPNTETLAEDLVAALTTIRGANGADSTQNSTDDLDRMDAQLECDNAIPINMDDVTHTHSSLPPFQLLLTPRPDVPGVSVADFEDATQQQQQRQDQQSTPTHTRTPSLSVPAEPAPNTIQPTPRPPV
ncbi:hypothetical protein E3P77_00080 [Wallemia ichthyophaga]|nr:hypothetical protein E3P77_00080 [Wallemia ichthyophaga]